MAWTRWRQQSGWAIAAGLALLAAWALVGRVPVDDSLDRVRTRGELRVGYALEAPYALLQADGTPGGESTEVAREVARRLGLRVRWVLTDFDLLIPELEAERFDLIAAGMFVTPERARRVRFSRPTLQVRPGWLRRRGAGGALGAYREAGRRRELRLAVVSGSVEAALLASLGPGGATLVVVPDALTGQEAVAAGRDDGLALSMPAVAAMAAGSGGQLVAEPADGPDTAPDRVALALRRDDRQLAEAVDAALGPYLGSAEHLSMLGPFGLGRADLPADDDGRP